MKASQKSRSLFPAMRGGRASMVGAFAFVLVATPCAQAQDAGKIFKAMADYVTSQKIVSVAFDSATEVVTTDLQKIQFNSSGQVLLSRPDKVRIQRTGGYTDIELTFDGKTATLLGKHLNAFAQVDAPGTVDELIDGLRDRLNVQIPGADLLMSDLNGTLMADVTDAKHIGHGVVDGVECDHLAFRSAELDWQLWVEIGARPIPRKYVITSKHVAGAPQYTLRIKEWKTDATAGPDAFAFKPPADAKKVEIVAMVDIDEVPAGVVLGAKK